MPANDPLAEIAAMLAAHGDLEVRKIGVALAAHVAGLDRADWRRRQRERRDQALRRAATVRFADLKTSEQARLLSRAMCRYWAGGWRADQILGADPYPPDSFTS